MTDRISPDFISSNQGSLIVLTPMKPTAEHWLQDNCLLDAGVFPDGSVAIEHRFFMPVAEALLSDGFIMQDAATGRLAQLPEA